MLIPLANDLTLKAQFATLTDSEKSAQWASFLDAIDAGEMGWHPYYLVLAPRYAAGLTPFDQKPPNG
jgi:hypothetical protein